MRGGRIRQEAGAIRTPRSFWLGLTIALLFCVSAFVLPSISLPWWALAVNQLIAMVGWLVAAAYYRD